VTLPDPHREPTLAVERAGREFFGFSRAKSYSEAARYEATNGAAGLPVVRFGRSLRAVTAECCRLCGLDPYATDAERETRPDRPDLASLDQRPNREHEPYTSA
jgi:hypothetical protein